MFWCKGAKMKIGSIIILRLV